MNLKTIFFSFLIFTCIGFNLPSTSFGNSQHLEIPTSSFKVSPEINEFQKLIEIYEQELTTLEVVGRAKSDQEEKRSQKIKKILFHLKHIIKALNASDSLEKIEHSL